MSQPDTLPPAAPNLTVPINTVPTTELNVDHLKALCKPVFDKAHSRNSTIAWAGVFGSVQRGTQRPDSDIDILVGFTAGASSFNDVCDGYADLYEELPKALGREVDIIVFTKSRVHGFAFVHLEALLTAETIWGDASWVQTEKEAAERLLRSGYATAKEASQIYSSLYKRLPPSQAEFASPENTALCLSILADALYVITLVKATGTPFYNVLKRTMMWLMAKEDAIREAIETKAENRNKLDEIWNVFSNKFNVMALKGVVGSARHTSSLAKLVL